MDKEKLEFFKEKLLKFKMAILSGGIIKSTEGLHISSDDLADEGDLATNVIHQHVSFSMKERELTKLRYIEEALGRVEDGTFGYCEDCDELIENKRLENQPWAKFCIVHAEERERESMHLQKQRA